jgi:hypothetical protein
VIAVGENGNSYEILVGKFEGQRQRGIKGVDGRIILKLLLNKMRLWSGSSWLRMGTRRRAVLNTPMNSKIQKMQEVC